MSKTELNYKENPYNAFPRDMRGTCCEISIPDEESAGIITVYAKENNKILTEMDEAPFGWKNKADFQVNPDLNWTYKLEYYEVKLADVSEDFNWNVADHAFNYENKYFESLHALTDYISKRWGITLSDFKKDYEISIPLG